MTGEAIAHVGSLGLPDGDGPGVAVGAEPAILGDQPPSMFDGRRVDQAIGGPPPSKGLSGEAGRHLVAPVRAPTMPATAMVRASAWRRPTTCTPTGRPSVVRPTGATGETPAREEVPAGATQEFRSATRQSSYTRCMEVATSRAEVGVRDLKNNLSRYLDRVQQGEEIIVTERGKPVARLSAMDRPSDRLAALIAAGAVRAPRSGQRRRPARRIEPRGPVSDFVVDQRR